MPHRRRRTPPTPSSTGSRTRTRATSGGLPISGLDKLDLSTTIYADVADILKKGDYTALPNSGWKSPAVYDALATGVQGLITGQSTVDSVLKSMDTAWDQ